MEITEKNKMKKPTVKDIQDKIFQKMPASRKLRLTAKFSDFLLNLHKLNKQNGISRTAKKNR
jgi:hypothetical protein